MAVAPVSIDVVDDAISEVTKQGADLRLVPNLWPSHDAVMASTLQFSMVRMRNAALRETGAKA